MSFGVERSLRELNDDLIMRVKHLDEKFGTDYHVVCIPVQKSALQVLSEFVESVAPHKSASVNAGIESGTQIRRSASPFGHKWSGRHS